MNSETRKGLAEELPLPPHFDPAKVGEVWRVPYQQRAADAKAWAEKHRLTRASKDPSNVGLVVVDAQNTFCIPEFELFVAGRSGTGAVDDNKRLCEFLYRNLGRITQVVPTMDTHQAMQIFHSIFLVNERGEHPEPFTLVSAEDVEQGRWRFNSNLVETLDLDEGYVNRHLIHYAHSLESGHKYDLTVWPYHSMLGGIGHALVSAVEEAVFFHGISRCSRPEFHVKGNNPLTEHYSVLGPEVTEGPDQDPIARKNEPLVEKLLEFDAVIIAGEAKSHCVAWTIDDLLTSVHARDQRLAEKVYLLEDCASPVVVPGVIDYTDEADAAYRRFSESGMHVVSSTDPMESWPGFSD